MVLIAAHLNAGVILVVTVRRKSPATPTSWDLGPCQYLFGHNWALNRFNHPQPVSFQGSRLLQQGMDRGLCSELQAHLSCPYGTTCAGL